MSKRTTTPAPTLAADDVAALCVLLREQIASDTALTDLWRRSIVTARREQAEALRRSHQYCAWKQYTQVDRAIHDYATATLRLNDLRQQLRTFETCRRRNIAQLDDLERRC